MQELLTAVIGIQLLVILRLSLLTREYKKALQHYIVKNQYEQEFWNGK